MMNIIVRNKIPTSQQCIPILHINIAIIETISSSLPTLTRQVGKQLSENRISWYNIFYKIITLIVPHSMILVKSICNFYVPTSLVAVNIASLLPIYYYNGDKCFFLN